MGLPPTSTKISTDTNPVTTFFFQFPNFTGSHTGATLSLEVNSVVGGGTGLSTVTTGDILYASASNTLSVLPIGSTGNALTVVGGIPAWGTLSPSFSGLTANAPVIADTSSTITTTTVGSVGQVFASNGGVTPPGWTTLSGTASFASFASSIINTDSSPIGSGSFTTFSNSPAFTITPTITGTYKVYSSISVLVNNSGNPFGNVRIYETSQLAALLYESQGTLFTTSASIASVFTQSVYTLVAGTTYIFDLQGLLFSGSIGISVAGGNTPFYVFCEGVGLAASSGNVNVVATSTSFTAAPGATYLVDTSTAITATLPAALTGNLITIKDYDGFASSNNITITPNGLDTIDLNPSLVLNTNFASVTLVGFTGHGWSIIGST